VAGPESLTVTLTRTSTHGFDISSNSRNLVYIADGVDGERELFRVPLTLNPDPDQQPTPLSGPMVEGGGVHSFRLPAGDGPVVYSAAQETPNIRELYSVGFGGGNRVKLNVPLPPGWRVGIASDHPHGFQGGYGISRDGRRVVYGIQSIGDPTQHRLHSVSTTGPASASRRLDVTTANTSPSDFHITADSRHVVYPVADRNGGPARAFSVPIDGPADARVQVSAGGDDGDVVQISPDGQRVVFHMPILNQDAALSSPVDEPFPSPNMVRLNGAERLTGPVVFGPLSQRVAYTANAVSGETDVFSSALGSQSRFNLTATLTADLIASLQASDQHAVYSAHVSDDGYQLYSSRLVPGTSG
jgi:dipeptidyl aminopeptidase/acylaminoacyl peptidase